MIWSSISTAQKAGHCWMRSLVESQPATCMWIDWGRTRGRCGGTLFFCGGEVLFFWVVLSDFMFFLSLIVGEKGHGPSNLTWLYYVKKFDSICSTRVDATTELCFHFRRGFIRCEFDWIFWNLNDLILVNTSKARFEDRPILVIVWVVPYWRKWSNLTIIFFGWVGQPPTNCWMFHNLPWFSFKDEISWNQANRIPKGPLKTPNAPKPSRK